MKNMFLTNLLIFLLIFQVNAQEGTLSNNFQSISAKISEVSTLSEISRAILEAEDIYKLNKNQSRDKREELANIEFDFAMFRKHIFEILTDKRSKNKFSKEEFVTYYNLYHDNAKKLENLLENSIEIYEKVLNVEKTQLATSKFELALFLDNYIPQALGAVKWQEKIKKTNKLQNLYLESLKLREKLLDKNDDLVLITSLYLANSYSQSADFEKALPLYNKYIFSLEEKFGKKDESLIPPLQMTAAIFETIGFESSVIKIEDRIFEISGKKQDLNGTLLYLSPRVKNFNYKGFNNKGGKVTIDTVPNLPKDSDLISRSPDPELTFYSERRINLKKTTNLVNVLLTPVITEVDFINVILAIVKIDENGEVIDVKAITDIQKTKNKVEKNIKEWQFKPVIYEGKAIKMKGLVIYYN